MTTTVATPTVKDAVYASLSTAQKLDLYLPAGNGPFPVVINIHGGGFSGGDKSNPAIADQLLAAGYAVASVNYRLSGEAKAPAQIQDIKAAVRWLRANAAKYNLNSQKFAAFGQSAGGSLAALLGTSCGVAALEGADLGNADQSSCVQAVVDWFGPTDFLQMDAHRIQGGMVHSTPDSPEAKLIGGPVLENKEKAARANPITYITKDDPPFLIIHGDADPLVPHHQSELLEAALKKANIPVSFYTVKGGGHGGFRDPNVPRITKEFLDKNLKPAQPKRSS